MFAEFDRRVFLSAVFSFSSLPNDESLIGVSKPLPKQLWEAKKVRPLLTLTSPPVGASCVIAWKQSCTCRSSLKCQTRLDT